ncbi:MAG: immunoglobulin domain-containing protein, partial [Limisphaerales bacterium]
PIIVTPPQSKMVLLNNSWSMSVTVMGATPLSYQWYRNGAKIFDDGLVSGTTSSNLTCSISLQSQAGNYSVVASNSFGTATSTAATLTIMTPLSISGPPNALAAVGSNAVFAAVIGGSQPSTNKWLFNGSVVVTNKHYSIFEIATNTGILSVLTLSNVQPSDVGGYSLMASNVLQSATSSVASLTVGFPPSITTQPQSQTVVTNGSVSFTVASDGDAPIIYQWYHNGTIVVDDAQTSGSQLATLSISNLSINNQGSYTVVCSNAFGNAGSTAALLTVLQAPSISDPQTLAVGVGSNATFSVLISGAVPETNQWYFNGTPLSNSSHITISEQPVAAGTNQSTLTIASIQDSDAGSYWVVASNMVGATTSSVGTLTIGYAPTITNQPTSQTVTNGIPFTLTVGATGSDPLSYQWYLGISSLGDGTRYTGTRTSSLTDTNPTSSDAGSYSVVVTNAFGSVTSSNAVVTVLIRPTVTAQPLGRSVPLGLATLFAASVTATTPLSYQWQLNGADIADATNSTYKIASVSTNDLGAYTLIVSNMAGVAVSSNALLTVGPVVGFGNNSYNQCIPPPGLSNVVAVTGVYCGFALTANGSLVKWGSSTSSPAIPIDFTNIVAFAANLNPPAFQGDRGLALRADGTVSGYAGTVPTTWTNITSVACGPNGLYALRSDGTVMTTDQSMPTNLNGVVAISPSATHGAALRNDGTVITWRSTAGAATNVPPGLSNVVAISSGYGICLAVRSNGTVAAWGTTGSTNLPAGLTNVIAVSASQSSGGTSGTTVCTAVRADGSIALWGSPVFTPTNVVAVTSISNAVTVSAGYYNGLAIINDGTPQFLILPVGGTAYSGRDFVLKAQAVGAPVITYQWLHDGNVVTDATNATLTLTNIQLTDAGNYQVVVTNALGSATSLAAPLKVINSAPWFVQQPASRTVYVGSSVNMGAGLVVNGSGPMTFKWTFSRNGIVQTNIVTTNSDLVLNPVRVSDMGTYSVVVTNAFGVLATGSAYNLTVQQVVSWGYSSYGKTNIPPTLTNAIAVVAGNYYNSIALLDNGLAQPWGFNGTKILGAFTNLVEVGVGDGYYYFYGLRKDGTPTVMSSITSVPTGLTNALAHMSNIIQIEADDLGSAYLHPDGTVT